MSFLRGEDLERLVRDMVERIRDSLESSISRLEPTIVGEYRRPRHELIQDGEYVYLVVEMPGCNKDKIDLRIDGLEIGIYGEYAEPPQPQFRRLHPFRDTLGYRKTITVARRLEPTGAEARYENGLLLVRIPFAKASGEKVRIE
ncbi:MAG: hypothetical protein QW756_01875 [Nitrososphaerota archaeon]